ncbi:hypothetical protein C8F04DRAFT_1284859 [Mycena alexandri]|uniref:Uncharacterized protein n=1 Tax=Mycena alexandri TaxID=1745969 RepID=A0AAD6RWH0_9AGAR|nr:hypothetical protein C8F04DRAFT_1284859 [Mycena alexandri]
MLAAETDEVREEFRKKGEEEFEEAMKDYEKSDRDGGSAIELDEAERAEARLRLVATHTGYYVTLVAGGIVNGQVTVRSAHAGTVDGKNEGGQGGVDFTRWDPAGYKNNVMKQFMRYIAAANGAPEGADNPASSASNPSSSMASTGGAAAPELPPTTPPLPPPPSSLPPLMPPMRAALINAPARR